ncbi:hypothetical protein PPERSA_05913 [Pseudocohnilembus persalinus]|uniref:Uncharacterized protein n=1 Tax=Pseudocohnilembus persalinus TaxID=266149 RepID=A0A0V0R430_PSEPJ|nr:hypothetical protein PPERSA_05913 [Pseudocohnilembus persalinus]|eukprot:KRX09244.1 hypothetical protein PPERSA_05913 [Pseudocohnilembus persalinus]
MAQNQPEEVFLGVDNSFLLKNMTLYQKIITIHYFYNDNSITVTRNEEDQVRFDQRLQDLIENIQVHQIPFDTDDDKEFYENLYENGLFEIFYYEKKEINKNPQKIVIYSKHQNKSLPEIKNILNSIKLQLKKCNLEIQLDFGNKNIIGQKSQQNPFQNIMVSLKQVPNSKYINQENEKQQGNSQQQKKNNINSAATTNLPTNESNISPDWKGRVFFKDIIQEIDNYEIEVTAPNLIKISQQV